MTLIVAEVLRHFIEDPTSDRYGLELMKETGLPSGTLYPVLARLEGAGWLISGRERPDQVAKGRPPRRYYRLTALGVSSATRELEGIQVRLGTPQVQRPVRPPIVAWGQA